MAVCGHAISINGFDNCRWYRAKTPTCALTQVFREAGRSLARYVIDYLTFPWNINAIPAESRMIE